MKKNFVKQGIFMETYIERYKEREKEKYLLEREYRFIQSRNK